MRKLEIGLYTGIMFGFRTFEPSDTHPYWEHHFYLPLFYFAFLFEPKEL